MRTPPHKLPRPQNVGRGIFVDESCINCDTCRWMAPDTYGHADGKAYVHNQPTARSAKLAALAALAACPVGSIRLHSPDPLMREVAATGFPAPVSASRLPNVFHLGYHDSASFGATPYLVRGVNPVVNAAEAGVNAAEAGVNAAEAGVNAANAGVNEAGASVNVMVDTPRFNSKLAQRLEELGGVDLLLLTHKDDVGEHNKWAARFPRMRRVMHKADVRGEERWPYIDMTGVEVQLQGEGPWDLAPGLRVVHTPGHSPGSLSFLFGRALTGGDGAIFTGDHLALNARLGRLDGFGRYGDNLEQQAASIAKIAELDYLWILPGHGRRISFESAEERKAAVLRCADEFARDPYGSKSATAPLYVEPKKQTARSST